MVPVFPGCPMLHTGQAMEVAWMLGIDGAASASVTRPPLAGQRCYGLGGMIEGRSEIVFDASLQLVCLLNFTETTEA